MSEVGEFDPFYRPRVGEIAAAREEAARRGGEDLSFDDFIDLINPLHHLPFIGPLYREITGDQINPAVQVVGGAIYGGPVGMVSAVTQAISEEATGKSLTGHALAALFGTSDTAVADSETHDTYGTAAVVAVEIDTGELPDLTVSTGNDASLTELAPAAGDEAPVLPPSTTRSKQDPPQMSAAGTSTETGDEAPLEGVDALRAFLKDRAAATAGDQSAPALDSAPAPIQKSQAATVDDQSSADTVAAVAPAAQEASTPSSVGAGRFMPVRPEHFTGRVAVRGPAGFAAESPAGLSATDSNGVAGESPFAARMMEALKKYSALQDPSEESARRQSRLP